ncbi:hypothetical protein J7J90_03215 [Candidatus Micrarchaeota archaeon]|nr:hypothetical protein [Candidatus Micrarchaeota archaeon]
MKTYFKGLNNGAIGQSKLKNNNEWVKDDPDDRLKYSVSLLVYNIQKMAFDYLYHIKHDSADNPVFCAMVSAEVIRNVFLGYSGSRQIVKDEKVMINLIEYALGNVDKAQLNLSDEEYSNVLFTVSHTIKILEAVDVHTRLSFIDDAIKKVEDETSKTNIETDTKQNKSPEIIEPPEVDFLMDPFDVLSDDAGVDAESDAEKGFIDPLNLLDENEIFENVVPEPQKNDDIQSVNVELDPNMKLIRTILVQRVYPKIRQLFFAYHISLEMIDVSNNALVGIAKFLDVTPKDLKIIIEQYPYGALPVDDETKLFTSDTNVNLALLRNLSNVINHKTKYLMEMAKRRRVIQ